MGSKTQQQTSQQSTTPINQGALQNIYNQVQSAASTPYTPYSGQLTAPVNAQQTAGINNINANANFASPYIQQAAGLASGAANPLTAAQIQQYQNPYTQNVVNATQAQFNNQNAEQQNSLKGTAAQQGALGGDRQAVAQAQLAGQQQLSQAPTIANLYANSYNSGLQTAGQQFQQNPLAAASSIGNLGVAGQNAALQGANQQINAGTLQQQTQQAEDTANYGQYQAKQAFPYQQAQFFEQYGLPSALAQGSTSNGTQTTPGPNTAAQIAGLGISAAGLFLKDGGSVDGYAPGGYINSGQGYVFGAPGYIPTANGPAQNTLQAPNLKFAQTSTANPFQSSISGLNGMKGAFAGEAYGGGNALTDAYGGSSSDPLEGLSASDYGAGFNVGGLVHAIHAIHKTIKRSRGGAVSGLPFQSFDDGGTASFDDRFSPAADNPFGAMPRGEALALLSNSRDGTTAPASIPGGESDVVNPGNPLRLDPAADQAWRDSVDHPNAAVMADAGQPNADGSAPNPMTNRPPLPPQITNPDNAPDNTPDTSSPALAYDSGSTAGPIGANGMPTVIAPAHSDQAPTESRFPHFSDKVSNALMAAGFGMLASRSPFAGVALGEGGLQGLRSYSESNAAEQAAADRQQTHDEAAQRLMLAIEQNKRAAASGPLVQDKNGNWIPNQALLKEKAQETALEADKIKYGPIAYDAAGLPINGFIDTTNKKLFDANGKPFTPSAGSTPTPAAASAVANPLTDGVVKANTAQAAAPFDYSRSTPLVEKGLDVPDPAPVAGKSTASLKSDAEMYLQTGKLPPIVARGQSPVAVLQNAYRTAVQNYANAKAASIGQTPEQIVNMWRTAPGMLKFIDGPDGRATVSLGTAVRHLDTLKQYIDAFNASDAPRIRQLQAVISREFGAEAATNIDAASAIVGPEIVKAIGIAGAGTRDERLNAESLFRSGSGQAKSAINVVERLLSGQLEGKERQARNSGVTPERFRDLVGDRPYEILKNIDRGGDTKSSGFTPPAGAVAKVYTGDNQKWKGKTFYYDPATKQPYPGQ